MKKTLWVILTREVARHKTLGRGLNTETFEWEIVLSISDTIEPKVADKRQLIHTERMISCRV